MEGDARLSDRGVRQSRFGDIYAEHSRAILAFAVRRTSDPDAAADIVADTFVVAWRRLESVPDGEETRLWLYGVARRVSANHDRSARRRERLADRLAKELSSALRDVSSGDGGGAVTDALMTLSAEDQEVLRLAAWEQLAPGEIATVLGVSGVAARSRLHRARRRLRAALADSRSVETSTSFRLEETE